MAHSVDPASAGPDALRHPLPDLSCSLRSAATSVSGSEAGPQCCAAPHVALTFGHPWGPQLWALCQCGQITPVPPSDEEVEG